MALSMSRQWNGFPSGIETLVTLRGPQQVSSRQWNGFPSGIETHQNDGPGHARPQVASGMASRQGLKRKGIEAWALRS